MTHYKCIIVIITNFCVFDVYFSSQKVGLEKVFFGGGVGLGDPGKNRIRLNSSSASSLTSGCERSLNYTHTRTIPDRTFPNTTWLPSSHGVLIVVIKNWEPFVSGPALAMLSNPLP